MSGKKRAPHLHGLEDDPDAEHEQADPDETPRKHDGQFPPGAPYELAGDAVLDEEAEQQSQIQQQDLQRKQPDFAAA